MAASKDLDLTHSDGSRAIREAARVQAHANRQYAKAIRALSTFVLDGKIPEESYSAIATARRGSAIPNSGVAAD